MSEKQQVYKKKGETTTHEEIKGGEQKPEGGDKKTEGVRGGRDGFRGGRGGFRGGRGGATEGYAPRQDRPKTQGGEGYHGGDRKPHY